MKKLTVIFIALLIAASALLVKFSMKITTGNTAVASANSNMIALSVPPTDGDTSDVVEEPLYVEGNKRAFYLRENGMVVTEDGAPVADPRNGEVVIYNGEDETFVNGANEALAVYLDSRLEKHYLRSGGKYLTTINLDKEVALINLNTTSGSRLIYAFVEELKRPLLEMIFNPTNLFNWEEARTVYRFHDMNGRLIDNKHLGEIKNATWWQIGITFLQPLFWIGTLASNGWSIRVVEILERTTLRELSTLMSYATVHPWDTLVCGETGKDVVTEDGHIIYVNPRTKQLTDRYGWALFSTKNCLPIVFHNNDIVTTDLKPQKIENAVLLDSMTLWQLLDSGTDFSMGIVSTPFGEFDIPIYNFSDNPKKPDWRLLNGDSADGVIQEAFPTEVLDGNSFSDLLRDMFGGGLFSGLFGGVGSTLSKVISVIVWVVVGFILFIFAVIVLRKLRDSGKNRPYKQNKYYQRNYKKLRRRSR